MPSVYRMNFVRNNCNAYEASQNIVLLFVIVYLFLADIRFQIGPSYAHLFRPRWPIFFDGFLYPSLPPVFLYSGIFHMHNWRRKQQ